MSLRETNRARVHARILEVCEAQFRARGFEATGIDDIIRDVGISRQTFFNYFAGKDAVLTELAVAWLRRQADLPTFNPNLPAGAPVLEATRRWVSGQALAIEADRDFMRLVVVRTGRSLASDGEPKGRRSQLGHQIFAAVAGIFRAGQAAGEIRDDIDPLRLAEVYVSAMLMTVRLWLIGEGDASERLEDRVNLTIDLLEGGLRTPARPGAGS